MKCCRDYDEDCPSMSILQIHACARHDLEDKTSGMCMYLEGRVAQGHSDINESKIIDMEPDNETESNNGKEKTQNRIGQ
jgi:hypothetical protein